MAAVSFHHGTRVFESAETPLLVRLAQTAVIGVAGTAPDADDELFQENKPIQLQRPADAAGLGTEGTLPEAIEQIFAIVGCPIIAVRIPDAATTAELWSNAVGSATNFTGIHAFRRARPDGLYMPKLLIVPGLTSGVISKAIKSITVTNGGSGYSAGTTTVSISGSSGGSGATAVPVIEDGVITAINVTANGSGYSGSVTVTITDSGSGKDATATAVVGDLMNPVVAELMNVAAELEAIAYVDGPDTTDQAAVQYRQLINSQRIAVCDPKVMNWDTDDSVYVPAPSSPVWAALQAKMDIERGFWHAASNIPVPGIGGTNRPIEYGTQSNYLNENRVNTIVNLDGTGFRLWGVWTCSQDLLNQFIPVRRTSDAINAGIRAGYLDFVAKPFSPANLKFMVEGGRRVLRLLEREGAILPGSDCWLLDTNTAEEMAQGIVKLGVKYEPAAPMVDIRITAHRNVVAYELLLDKVVQELASGSLAAAA